MYRTASIGGEEEEGRYPTFAAAAFLAAIQAVEGDQATKSEGEEEGLSPIYTCLHYDSSAVLGFTDSEAAP